MIADYTKNNIYSYKIDIVEIMHKILMPLVIYILTSFSCLNAKSAFSTMAKLICSKGCKTPCENPNTASFCLNICKIKIKDCNAKGYKLHTGDINDAQIYNGAVFCSMIHKIFDQNRHKKHKREKVTSRYTTHMIKLLRATSQKANFNFLSYKDPYKNHDVVTMYCLDQDKRTIYLIYKATHPTSIADIRNDLRIGIANMLYHIAAKAGDHDSAKKAISFLFKHKKNIRLLHKIRNKSRTDQKRTLFKNNRSIKRIHKAARWIRKYKSKYDKIVVCGHSLGGAMAQVAYQYIIKNKLGDIKNTTLITYNSPGMGHFLHNSYNNNIHNVNIKGDVVSQVGVPMKGNVYFIGSSNNVDYAHSKALYQALNLNYRFF